MYQAALLDERISPKFRSILYQNLGEVWEHQGDWENAKENHLQSLDFDKSSASNVFIARCYNELNGSTQALKHLESIDYELLDDGGKKDYALVFSGIAISSLTDAQIQKSINLLKSMSLESPHFREKRDRLLIELLQLLQEPKQTKENVAKIKTTLFQLLKFVNRYVLLQPNFMGLGIDINKAIADLSSISRPDDDKDDSS